MRPQSAHLRSHAVRIDMPRWRVLCQKCCRLLAIISWWSILGSFTVELAVADEAIPAEQAELMEANAVLREELRLLREQDRRRQEELLELRSRHARLLLASDRALNEAAAMELAAGHLLLENSGGDDGSAAALLSALSLVRRQLLLVNQRLAECKVAVESVLTACDASQTARDVVEKRLDALQVAVNDSLQPLSIADPDSFRNAVADSPTILRIDRPSQSVILDCGYLNGVRLDMRFELRRDGVVVATVAVVECRLLKCVAVLLDGDFEQLVPGAMLHRVKLLPPKN